MASAVPNTQGFRQGSNLLMSHQALQLIRVSLEQVGIVTPLFDAYRQFYRQKPDCDGACQFLFERHQRGQSIVFAVVEHGQALGFTQLYPSFSSVSMKAIWILNDLFVVEEARRRGVGEQLLKAATDFAKQTGAVRLELSTVIDNFKAQVFYNRLGWKRKQLSSITNLRSLETAATNAKSRQCLTP
jgi:GNAT superfamily N-acetyltransferase